MVLGVDGREIQDGVFTGIGRAADLFIKYISTLTHDRCVVFSTHPLACPYPEPVVNRVAEGRSTLHWDQVVLPRLLRESHADVMLSPYYKIPLLSPCPAVSTVMDLMYLYCDLYRASLSPASWLYYRTVGTLMAHRCRKIVTCSEYSRSEILRFHRVASDKVHVIHLGLDPAFQPAISASRLNQTRRRFGISGDYILYCGNHRPHKNIATLLEAYGAVATAAGSAQLVLAGKPTGQSPRLRDQLARHVLRDRIVETGPIGQDDQIALYCGAVVTVVPSLYEGFGYPAVESMACGTPVIASNRTSLPEVGSDAALYFDPFTPGELAECLRKVLGSADLRNELRKKGLRRAGELSAERYCSKLHAVLTCAVK